MASSSGIQQAMVELNESTPLIDQKCMICRKRTPVRFYTHCSCPNCKIAGNTVEENCGRKLCSVCSCPNCLVPGDHIELPMKFCGIPLPCKHHAIVMDIKSVAENGLSATIDVMEVPGKLHKNGNSVQLTTKHVRSCDVTKIDYRLNRHHQQETKRRAENAKNNKVQGGYCCCLRNCEHFAIKMVFGREKSEKNINTPTTKSNTGLMENQTTTQSKFDSKVTELNDASSLQAVRFCWISLQIFFTIVQGLLYGYNFLVYAVINDYNSNVDENVTDYHVQKFYKAAKFCSTSKSNRGIKTWCDWMTLGIMIGCYIFVIILMICLSCGRCYKKLDSTCSQCKCARIIVLITKLVCFILFTILTIFAEDWIYKAINLFHASYATAIIVIIIMSVVELTLAFYIAPHIIAKHIFIRNLCCSEGGFFRCKPCKLCPQCCDEGSYEYVVNYV